MRKRFEEKEHQYISGGVLKIIVDTETGVHYLISGGMGLSGMTPLLDQDGKVIVKK